MAGRPSIIRPVYLTVSIPEDISAKLKLRLFSEVEGRVPHGAYKRLLVQLLRQYLETEPMELPDDLP